MCKKASNISSDTIFPRFKRYCVLLITLFFFFFISIITFSVQAETKCFMSSAGISPNQTRVLEFPSDRSIGFVYIREFTAHGNESEKVTWEYLGKARGELHVPINKEVRLNINIDAVKDLSPLELLEPNAVYALKLPRTQIDDDAWNQILHLKKLEELNCGGSQITDKYVKRIQELRSLKRLDLGSTQVSDTGIQYLSELPFLESLSLWSTPITNTALIHISNLKSLKDLYLGLTNIDDKGIAHIKVVPMRWTESPLN